MHVGQLKLNTLCKGIKEAVKVALWEGRVHFCSLEGEWRRKGKNFSESDSSGGEPLETGSGRQKVNRRLRSDALLETINT